MISAVSRTVSMSITSRMLNAHQNIGGYTKRQTVNSLTFVAYCIGSESGTFRDRIDNQTSPVPTFSSLPKKPQGIQRRQR
jgi:hypothetical protein